jgi:glycerol-3-phosphate responsive antiterminator
VCADPAEPGTLARELRALTAASTEHPRAIQRLLVLDRAAVRRGYAPGVEVGAVADWLLTAATW